MKTILTEQKGILIIAHGSKDSRWVKDIEQTRIAVECSIPLEISFLDHVSGRTIADGVYHLEQQGVSKLLIIPLFITMGSTHLHEIQYALGIVEELRIDSRIRKIHTRAQISWSPPLEDHPIVLEILAQRIDVLTSSPTQEVLLLIAHGSEHSGFHERWNVLLRTLIIKLRERYGFLAASYATLHPDNVRIRANSLSRKHKMIVVPLFISEGYFTRTLIRSKLEGLSYVYDGRTLLPDERISRWIHLSIKQWS
jgi:sirohydrochlorin cobaltochelatase